MLVAKPDLFCAVCYANIHQPNQLAVPQYANTYNPLDMLYHTRLNTQIGPLGWLNSDTRTVSQQLQGSRSSKAHKVIHIEKFVDTTSGRGCNVAIVTWLACFINFYTSSGVYPHH